MRYSYNPWADAQRGRNAILLEASSTESSEMKGKC